MTACESIVDELGQITFRLETNLETLHRYVNDDKESLSLFVVIQQDIEKLKYLKQKLIIHTSNEKENTPPIQGVVPPAFKFWPPPHSL